MLCRPNQGSSEEAYYLGEWSQAERASGLHLQALAFAHEAKSERGWARSAADSPPPRARPCCGPGCCFGCMERSRCRQRQGTAASGASGCELLGARPSPPA
jgi:hypothetical protein